MPPGSTILEVQAETGLEELAGEEEDDAFDVETIDALKQYASKVRNQRCFHGLPAALRGWCSSPRLAWVLSVLPSLVLLYICFSAMPALRRETEQGSRERATTDRWLTVKDLERGSFVLDPLASSYRVLGLPPLTCCGHRFGKSRDLL